MRGLQAEKRAGIAVHIDRFAALRRLGGDLQLVAQQPLRRAVQWLEVRHVLRGLHRGRVLVARFVDDVQQHANSDQAPTLRRDSPEWVKYWAPSWSDNL